MTRLTKVAEFDMLNARDRQEYSDLVSKPGVAVEKNSDFFGVGGGGGEDGAYPMITRLVDYTEREEIVERPVFVPRML